MWSFPDIGSADRRFIVKRTVNLEADQPNSDDSLINNFLKHELCQSLFDAAFRTLLVCPLALAAGYATGASPATTSCLVLASAIITLLPKPNFPHFTHPASIPKSPIDSAFTKTTLSATDFLNSLSNLAISHSLSKLLNKLPNGAIANDCCYGEEILEQPMYGAMQGAQDFIPHNLSLFHIALLAYIVHAEYPIYSVFKNNCFWFMDLIFRAAAMLDYILGTQTDDLELPVVDHVESNEGTTDQLFVPFQHYLPDIAGCWLGVKIAKAR